MPAETRAPTVSRYHGNDEDFADALSSLEQVAWRQLFDEDYDAVYHYAQLLGGLPAAADIAFSVFIEATKQPATFASRHGGAISRLFELTDRALARQKKPNGRGDGALDGLRDAIAGLSADQRDVLVLRLIEGLDVERAAEMLGLRPDAVRSRQIRALQRLSRDHGRLPSDGVRQAESTLDECIDGLVRGEALEDVLLMQRGRGLDLLPMLRVANAVVRLPRDPAPDGARDHALHAILREIEAARFQNARQPRPRMPTEHSSPALRALASRRLPRRPPLFGVLALGLATIVFGFARLGGAPAGSLSDSLASSELPRPSTLLRGRVLANNGDTLWVANGSEPQLVKITPATQILRGDAPGTLDGASPGATAEVLGTLKLDGAFDAVVVRVRNASFTQAPPVAAGATNASVGAPLPANTPAVDDAGH